MRKRDNEVGPPPTDTVGYTCVVQWRLGLQKVSGVVGVHKSIY